jgi:phage baseplate assembly protein W
MSDNANIGSDFDCVSDITASLTVVSGRKALAQAVARRWITHPGDLVYDPDYGFGLLSYVSGAMQSTGVIAAGLVAEALKDERVEACTVQVSFVGETLTVVGQLEDADGPFDLTFSLSTTTLTVETLAVT